MNAERWKEVSKANSCPACGKADWCAWTPDGAMLKCERTTEVPPGMVLVKPQDGGGLFRHSGDAAPRFPATAAPKARKVQMVYKTADDAIAAAGRSAGGRLADVWQYATFRVARFDLPGTDPETGKPMKTFRPVHPVNGGWVLGDPPGLLPMYRADKLPGKGPIFIVEGERKADVLASFGLTAVTSAHGEKAAGKTDWQPLAGLDVFIMPDHDARGDGYTDAVGTILTALDPPAFVRVVNLPGLPHKGDIVDWVSADGPMGCKAPDEIRATVLDLAQKATPWTPPVVSTSTPTARPVEPYRPFPVDSLPEPMRSFVAQAAEAVGCDAAFVALPLLAASAAAIGNTRRIELKRGWTEPAILWTAIIGESGTLKSPALELALRPIRRRQHEAMKRHAQEIKEYKTQLLGYEKSLAAWKRQKGAGEPPAKPEEPTAERCWCDDTTIEALAVLLLENWRGLLLVRDELAGWLGGFDRYTRGNGAEVSRWVEMHGGRSITVDRKTGNRKTIYVPLAAVSVAGGIQPATLQRALGREYFENGLAARLLLACPPRRVKNWTEAEIDQATEKAVATVLDRLYSIEPVLGDDGEPEPGIVRLSAEAKQAWVAFYNEHAQEHVDLTGDLSAAWSKLEGYAARLALVAHLVRWAAGVALSRWFGQETRRVYAILGETDVDRQRRDLVELVRRHGGSVTARDLMRSCRTYATSETAEQALNGLVQAGDGRWEDAGPTGQGGRPTRRFVLADAVDVDETRKTLEKPGVSSTEPVKPTVPPVATPAVLVLPPVDKTPELPKESEVSSTSTPSAPQRAIVFDPDRPGPTDLLAQEQYQRYRAVYDAHDSEPGEKHAAAWRAAAAGQKN